MLRSDIKIQFGRNVRSTRFSLGLSQSQLAKKAGLHKIYINGIESGKRNVSLVNIQKLQNALRVPITNLFNFSHLKKYKAVIFDLHFTILRLHPSRGKVYQAILKKNGLKISPNAIRQAFSETWRERGDTQIAKEMSGLTTMSKNELWWSDFHYSMIQKFKCRNRKKSDRISAEISKRFYGDPRAHRPYRDALSILKFLHRRGVPLALASNGYHITRKVINFYNLETYFQYIFISGEMGISKPDPKVFIACAKQLGIKLGDVLMVGDSYTCDILGARRAGCGAAIIDRANRKDKRHSGCIYLNNLLQIKSLVVC